MAESSVQAFVESSDPVLYQDSCSNVSEEPDVKCGVDKATECNPDNTAGAMPPLELPNLEENSRGSTPSEGNTPRDTSSSSASPVPDEQDRPKRKINLGRDISLMMQALNSLHSPEEKLAALCKKYADLLEQQKAKDKRVRGLERKLLQSGKEKDQVQKELNKAILGKSRMESLARELNKQNKLLKEESLQLTVTHNKERELVSVKFQTATDEISGRINAIADRNEVLNERNREMSDKIEKLLEESVTREKMVKKVMEQRDLQEKILELKAKEAEGERDAALEAIKELRSQVEKSKQLYEEQEKELKAQIVFYSNKVAMFQSTLDKSNDVFSKFRSEMDGMGKSIKTLEKASEYWKKCCNEVTIENGKVKKELKSSNDMVARLDAKVKKLSELCRALQAERHELAKSTVSKSDETAGDGSTEPADNAIDEGKSNEPTQLESSTVSEPASTSEETEGPSVQAHSEDNVTGECGKTSISHEADTNEQDPPLEAGNVAQPTQSEVETNPVAV